MRKEAEASSSVLYLSWVVGVGGSEVLAGGDYLNNVTIKKYYFPKIIKSVGVKSFSIRILISSSQLLVIGGIRTIHGLH